MSHRSRHRVERVEVDDRPSLGAYALTCVAWWFIRACGPPGYAMPGTATRWLPRAVDVTPGDIPPLLDLTH